MSEMNDIINTLAIGKMLVQKPDDVELFLMQQYTRKLIKILGNADANPTKVATAVADIIEATADYSEEMDRLDRDDDSTTGEK